MVLSAGAPWGCMVVRVGGDIFRFAWEERRSEMSKSDKHKKMVILSCAKIIPSETGDNWGKIYCAGLKKIGKEWSLRWEDHVLRKICEIAPECKCEWDCWCTFNVLLKCVLLLTTRCKIVFSKHVLPILLSLKFFSPCTGSEIFSCQENPKFCVVWFMHGRVTLL